MAIQSITQTTIVWYVQCDCCGFAGPTAATKAAAIAAAKTAGFVSYVAPAVSPSAGNNIIMGPECISANKVAVS